MQLLKKVTKRIFNKTLKHETVNSGNITSFDERYYYHQSRKTKKKKKSIEKIQYYQCF